MSRLKFINETIISDNDNISVLELNIKKLKTKSEKLRSEDRKLKKLNNAMIEYNEHILNAKYNTMEIEKIKKQLLKDNKTIKTLKSNINKLTNEKKTLEKCNECNKIDWTYCYKDLNLNLISDNKFKCNTCSDILYCDCYDCYNKTNTTGTFRKLLDKYNLLTEIINNDTIQLEANNNILNNNITELNELNILLKWNNKSPELFNFNFNFDINSKIINITNLISLTQNNINDDNIKLENNKQELISISKELDKVCMHNRVYDNKTYHSFDGIEYKSMCKGSCCTILEKEYISYGRIISKMKCNYCHNIFNLMYTPDD